MGSTSAMPTATCTRRPTSASWARPQAPPYRAPRRSPVRPARLRLPACRGLPYTFGPVKDFMSAPTQYASVALALSPNVKFHANIGYRISSVNGSRFFNDPRDVNGSLVSTYLSPFVNLSYAIAKESDLKGRVRLLRVRRGWPFGSTVLQSLQHAPDSDYPGSSRALQHAAKYCDEWSGLRVHRSSQLPCKQLNRWSALRVLKISVSLTHGVAEKRPRRSASKSRASSQIVDL